jgi:uncharacterized protein YggE
MTGDVVISVRGEATTRVEPDQATLLGGIRIAGREKSAVLAEAAAALEAVESDLALLDGVVATPSTARVPLAWLASSATSYEEMRWNERAEEEQPTGRVIGTVDVEIRVRDFALLDRVADRLTVHPTMHVHHTGWSVDDDNPAWPRVRADAIRAALHRARDYAAALGGSVARVEQIADAGLLEGADQSVRLFGGARAVASSMESASPRLTPQPQVLQAAIDARVVASVPDLSL